jgi:hypothetical protein
VSATEESKVFDRARTAECEGVLVMDLESRALAATSAFRILERAAARVALPHGAANRRRYVAGCISRHRRPLVRSLVHPLRRGFGYLGPLRRGFGGYLIGPLRRGFVGYLGPLRNGSPTVTRASVGRLGSARLFDRCLPALSQMLHERGHRKLVNARNIAIGNSMLEEVPSFFEEFHVLLTGCKLHFVPERTDSR